MPKPDITITPEMGISELGVVDQIVERMVLIKASNPDDRKVVQTGSAVCLEDRTLLGAVMEPHSYTIQQLYVLPNAL